MSRRRDMDSSTMSTPFSSFKDQTPLYAPRVQSSSPLSSFGPAQGRCAAAASTPAHDNLERIPYSLFGYSTPTASESPVAPPTTRRSPPPPPAITPTRPNSRQGTLPSPSPPFALPAPSSDPQSPRFIAPNKASHAGSVSGHSQQSRSTTDEREIEIGSLEGTFSSEDPQLDQAFIPPALPTPKKWRHPAYHYRSTTGSPTAAPRDKIRERDSAPRPRSRTSPQPSFNPTGVGGVRPMNNVPMSIAGTLSSSNSRSGGYSQSISTRDSILSSDFYAPSASTAGTELSTSGTGPGADSKWLTGVGYDGVQSAQACSFSKATGRNWDGRPAVLKGSGDAIMMGTARSGHWVNHLVIRTRKEHIAGRYHVDPNLDVPDHATALKTNSLNPTYRRPHSNRLVERAPASWRTTEVRDSRDSTLSSQKEKQGAQARPWKPGAAANETICHALIDSRSGGVDIKLHVGGLGEEHADKALIDVRSKTGKVRVNLIELSGGRRVHLDVVTGKGNIEVFLPRSFSGPLHVQSMAGEITILPRLASTMEVVAAREDDALVMISPAPPTPWTVLSDDGGSRVEAPPLTPKEGIPSGPLYGEQNVGSLTAISETGGPATSHSNPRSRVGSPSPKPWAKYTTPEQEYGRFGRSGRPVGLPFDFNELKRHGANGFGAGAQAWNGDYASVVSAKGNVVVGFVGEDVESGKKGFWKRLLGTFKGKRWHYLRQSQELDRSPY